VAKTYDLTLPGKPVLALTLEAGGSLEVGVPHYYRVVTAANALTGSCEWLSPASDVQSITPTTTHRSVRLTVTHYSGNPEYFLAWCSKGADPGAGNWNDADTNGHIRTIGDGHLYHYALDRTKLTTWLDDGTSDGWNLDHYRLDGNGGGNYSFVPLFEAGKARLTAYGSTPSDPISFDDIYAESITAGWDPAATIEKIELGADPPVGFMTAYRLNFHFLTFFDQLSTGDEYLVDGDKLIVCNACLVNIRVACDLGEIDSGRDSTHSGIVWILAGHGFTFGRVSFDVASYAARVFDTLVRICEYEWSISTNYLAGFSIRGEDWKFVDLTCKGRRGDQGLNNSISIYDATSACEYRRISTARHRYGGWNSAPEPFTIDALNVWTWGGNGFISYQLRNDDTERVMSGVTIHGIPGEYESLYLRRRSATWGYQTKLALVDSSIYDFSRVRWYGSSTELPEIPGSYVDLRFSFDVRVADNDGVPIAGATVTLVDSSLVTLFTETTGVDGRIATQTVTERRNEPDPSQGLVSSYIGGVITEYGPFQIVVSADGYDDFQTEFDITEAVSLEVGMNAFQIAGEALNVELAGALEATIADDELTVEVDDLEVAVADDVESVIVDETETGVRS